MKSIILSVATAVCLCGCASDKSSAKKTYERPWIGGKFETMSTPASVRTNTVKFAKRGALLTRAEKDAPLSNAGLQEGDLILAVNGKNVRYDREVRSAVEKNGVMPSTFAIYRGGEVMEKAVAPGVERFQKQRMIVFGIALSTHFDVDIYPNPDFSLIALGCETKRDRLDLHGPKGRYMKGFQEKESPKTVAAGLRSEEGWKVWLGPVWFTENKMILSQEPAPSR